MAGGDSGQNLPTGVSAEPRKKFKDLTVDQRAVIWRITLRTHQLAEDEALRMQQADSSDAYQSAQHMRRPQNVFLIDGARGSGKTTMLFTARWLMEAMGKRPSLSEGGRSLGQDQPEEFLRELAQAFIDSKDRNTGGDQASALHPDYFFQTHHVSQAGSRHTVYALQPVFPSDLEVNQPIMEGVLASMARRLDKEIKDKTISEDKRVKLQKLRDEAHQQVITGWYLSQNEGQEALVRDSLSFKDYIKNRGERSGESFRRVVSWRKFVNDFLDAMESQLLGVFLDDTDVRPETTADMMNAIRIFLDHPRIVTVLAGNIRTMRQSLVLTRLSKLRDPITALSGPHDADAVEWRRNQRHEIEEYLDKVIPRYNRFFLTMHTNSVTEHEPSVKDDFETVLDISFDQLCWEQIKRFEPSYVQARIRSALGLETVRLSNNREGGALLHPLAKDTDIGENRPAATAVDIENYMAWWLFWTTYGYELRPRSLRQLIVLSQSTRPKPGSLRLVDSLPGEHNKRLSVVLFESPENAVLIHRFGDADRSIDDWVRRQNVRSEWRGERYFDINERKLFSGGYSFDYLSFSMDLSTANPVQGRAKFAPLRELLPVVCGENLSGRFPFFSKPDAPQAQYGIAGAMRHALIPANCLYFSDLDYLPDVVWDDLEGNHQKQWSTDLAYDWHRVFRLSRGRDDQKGVQFSLSDEQLQSLVGPSSKYGELILEAFGQEKDIIKSKDWINERLHKKYSLDDYWIDVVLPLGSLQLTRFQTFQTSALRSNERLIDKELSSAPEPFFLDQIAKLESARRQLDYLCAVAPDLVDRDPLQRKTLERIAKDVLEELLAHDTSLPDEEISFEIKAVRPRLNDYAWMICHARRAWHAGRIAYGQVISASTFGGRRQRQRSFSVSREDRYELPSRREMFQLLFGLAFPSGRTVGALADIPSNLHEWGREQVLGFSPLDDDELSIGLDDAKPTARLKSWKDLTAPGECMGPEKITEVIANCLRDESNRAIDEWAIKLEPPREFGGERPKQGDACSIFLPRMPARAPESGDENPSRRQAKHDLQREQHALYERAFIFFIWGVAPSLPALIHMEIAAEAYGVVKSNSKKDYRVEKTTGAVNKDLENARSELKGEVLPKIASVLNDWLSIVQMFHRYTLRSRIGCEYDLVQLLFASTARSDDRVGNGWSDKDSPMIAPRFPDTAVETLGLAGPAAFAVALRQAHNQGGARTRKSRAASDMPEKTGRVRTELNKRIVDWLKRSPSRHADARLCEDDVKIDTRENGGDDQNGEAWRKLDGMLRQNWRDQQGIYADIETNLDASLQYIASIGHTLGLPLAKAKSGVGGRRFDVKKAKPGDGMSSWVELKPSASK